MEFPAYRSHFFFWYSSENIIWALSSKFLSSSIPSWQILTAHAEPFRTARDLAFCLKVPLDSLLVWVSSEGAGETAQMHRLAWTSAACIGDKYQICLIRPIWCSMAHYKTGVRSGITRIYNIGGRGGILIMGLQCSKCLSEKLKDCFRLCRLFKQGKFSMFWLIKIPKQWCRVFLQEFVIETCGLST